MDDLNLSKWGTRVFWVSFTLVLIAGGWATVPPRGVGSVSVLGIMMPWKWVMAAMFFAALAVAYMVAMAFDHFTTRPPSDAPSETYELNN
jgi:hypothetical protein